MAEWVYHQNKARATRADAHDLAAIDGFLCCFAFAHGTEEATRIADAAIGEVAHGDVIHYYFRNPDGTVRAFGSFRVVDGTAHPGAFTPVPGTALVSVNETPDNKKMVGRLVRGYSRDPKLQSFTGWAIERLPPESGTPGFDQARMFPTPGTRLWRYPDPALQKSKTDPGASGG